MGGPIERWVESLSTSELVDLVKIVAEQDPTEAKNGGGARWNSAERELIMAATEVVGEELG